MLIKNRYLNDSNKQERIIFIFVLSLRIVKVINMSDISFVFFTISWGATIGLYVNHTHLHETKFQKIMVIILIISLVATLITF